MSGEQRRREMTDMQRPRAVFSNEDFRLIRSAIEHYLPLVRDQPDSVKFANLYHRRGRLG